MVKTIQPLLYKTMGDNNKFENCYNKFHIQKNKLGLISIVFTNIPNESKKL